VSQNDRRWDIRKRLRSVPDPVALLERIFAYSPLGLQIYSADGHSLVVNQAFLDLFGCEPPPDYHVFTDDILAAAGMLERIRAAFAGETVTLPPIWYDPRELKQTKACEGRRVAVEATMFPLLDARGAVSHVVSVFKDVTAAALSAERAEKLERRYRTLTETTAQVVWVADRAGRFVEDSLSWRAFTGQTRHEHLGLGWLDAVHPDDRGRVQKAWTDATAAATPYDVEYRLRRTDGSWAVTVSRAAPVRDADGAVVEWVGMNFDISEQRRLNDQLHMVAAVVENTPDFVSIADPDGRPFYLNPAGRRMVGLPADCDVRSAELLEYYPREARELAREAIAALVRGGSWSSETYIHNWVTGEKIPVSDTYFQVKEPSTGRLLGYANITRDISVEHRAAREREQLLSRAEQARREAEEASRAKDEFLAMLGHELRNPLAPIVTALQIMKLRGDTASNREQQVIERQVQHLVRLVDDLLDVSRITRGKIELKQEPVELSSVAAKAVEIASPLFEQRRHYLTVDIPRTGLRTLGDPVRLAQVVANLLTNAAKYTEPGGNISIRARREPDLVVLIVEDTGTGITPELLPRIFDMFVQGPRSTDRSQGGLGLGLALVRSLVELHGGSVQARSEGSGRGSTFEIRLPALPAPAGMDEPSAPKLVVQQAALRPADLLVVDDNQDAADVLAEALRAAGHNVRVAYNGPTALTLVEQFQPAVAILDIGLPVMDGYELAARLREFRPTTRLLAVTGYGQERDQERSRAAGFDQHLIKPVDPTRLVALVDRMLR